MSVRDALAGDFSRSHNFAKVIAKVKIETGRPLPFSIEPVRLARRHEETRMTEEFC